MKLISITPASNGKNKYTAIFDVDGRKRTTHFGASGMMDFIKYSKENKEVAAERRRAYLSRHGNESWTDPTKAGTLSRYILWEYPSLTRAISEYKKKYNL